MNVGPVHASSAGIERQTYEKKLQAAPSRSLPTAAPGDSPQARVVKTQDSPAPFTIPEHDVKVQWDTAAGRTLIYQVLDKQSGALVLQVPSAEVLSDIHQTQELLQRIASRATASASATTVK